MAWTGGPPGISSAHSWGAIVPGVLIEEGPNHEMFMRVEDLESSEPADILRDGTVLVSVNSVAHLTMLACAEHFGVPAEEVDFVPLDGAETIQAFTSGEGDVAMAWSPPSVRLINDPEERFESVCSAEMSGNKIYSLYMVHPDFWEADPDLTAAWLSAVYQANEWINENPDEALQHMLSYYEDIGNEGGEESAKIELDRRNFYSLEQNLDAFENGEFDEVVGTMAQFFVDAGAWAEMPDVAGIAETGREVAEAAQALR